MSELDCSRHPRHVAKNRLACWCKEVHCVRSAKSQSLMEELPVTGSWTQAAIELHASVSPDRWCVTRANLEYLQQQASFAAGGLKPETCHKNEDLEV